MTDEEDAEAMNSRDLIMSLRGEPEPRCDQCEADTPIDELHPVSGDEWLCEKCFQALIAELMDSAFGTPASLVKPPRRQVWVSFDRPTWWFVCSSLILIGFVCGALLAAMLQ